MRLLWHIGLPPAILITNFGVIWWPEITGFINFLRGQNWIHEFGIIGRHNMVLHSAHVTQEWGSCHGQWPSCGMCWPAAEYFGAMGTLRETLWPQPRRRIHSVRAFWKTPLSHLRRNPCAVSDPEGTLVTPTEEFLCLQQSGRHFCHT